MSRIVRNLMGRLFGNKPTPPTLPGHRGIAMRSQAKPDLTSYRDRIARGQTNEIAPDELEDFISGGNPIFVHSSNVGMIQFFPEVEKMMVEFLNGGKYLYSNVTEHEARLIATAQSKGSILWDLFRVRGTKHGHKKPFVKL